ncbi:DMT family transporter [Burkholderiaceae bacterium FT117]|uniref:DMT family transporter n=1 Tax=Zeimonas sediminis TaxID=2944268 RepID=UPI002343131D|nr:DMT family transporter [Zeimonas sediminis]MCM5570409.1 DMT family transporter [Zeimonas sediminis]
MPPSSPAAAGHQPYRPLLGILFMLTAASLFPVMNGLAKLMSQGYSSEQVVWARTVSHLVFMLALFVPKAGWRVVRTRRPGVQFLRSCMLIGSTFLYFTALKYVPMAQAASISFTAPLIVVMLAGPILGEKVTLSRIAAVLAGFAGVLVVIRPGSAVFQWASLLILGTATCYAIYQILTRRVAGFDPPETSAVYSALVGSLLMSLVVPFSWRTPTSATDALLLVSLGVIGGLGHYCVARAMTYAPANFVSPFQYWQMIGSVAVGYLLFAEVPDAFTWLGAAMIIAAGIYVGISGQAGKAAR